MTNGQTDIDEAKLGHWLAGRLPGLAGAPSVQRMSGGQSNPTYLLESPGRRWVLRKRPPGALLPSAHLIEREYRVMSALSGTGVPVPAMRLYCDDPEVIGTAFYVMDFLDGRILRSPALPEVPREARAAHYDAMNETLARLHQVDLAQAGLADYGKPGDYFARQIGRWTKQFEASRTLPIPAMDFLIEWLPRHVPPQGTTALVHGDYRIDNLVFHETEPRVMGVLDWELSTLGDPLADVAYNCLPYHLPQGRLVLNGIEGLDLAAAGIPTERDYLAQYFRRIGRGDVPDLRFHLAFSLFRLAAIAQGVAARAVHGNASSANAALVGAFASDLAARGQALAESAG